MDLTNSTTQAQSNADLWERLVSAGTSRDAATTLVQRRDSWESAAPADAWESLVRGGVPENGATKYLSSRAQPAAPPVGRPTTSTARTLADNFSNGVYFGAGRKLAAAATSILQHGDLNSYRFNLMATDDLAARERSEHPVASVGGEVAGFVASPLNEILSLLPWLRSASAPTSLAGKVALGAKSGATAGAVAGVANADGSPAAHLKGGLLGAVEGGAGGAAIAPVVAGAGAAMRAAAPALADRLNAGLFGRSGANVGAKVSDRSAADVLLPAIERAETTPAAIAADRPSMLADILPDLTRTVRSMSPAARRAIDPALAARRAEQIPKIADALETGLGVQRGSIRQSVNDIVTQRAADARPMYERAYAAPDITDPAVLETLRLPQFQSAYKVAQRIAHAEGNPLPDLQGATIPVPSSIKDNPAAVAAFTKAYQAQNPTAGGVPLRAVDLVKRGLNDNISAGLRSGNMGRAEARALQSRLSDMLTRVDAAAPDYSKARAAFAGHSALADAAEAGLDFMSPKLAAADVSAHIGDLSPSEQELYRRGAIEALMTKLESARGSATGSADLVSRFYSSVGGRAKVQALFPDEGAYQAFDKAMARLAEQNASAAFITGGSQTADKLAQQGEFRSSTAAKSAANFIRHPLREALAATADAVDQSMRVGSRRAAAGVAPSLIATGPELDALLRALQAAKNPAARDAVLIRAMSTRAGAAAPMLRGLLSPD